MTSSQSPTPETDAAAIGFARLIVNKDTFSTTELVEANFARALERENHDLSMRLMRKAEQAAEIQADNDVVRSALATYIRHAEEDSERLPCCQEILDQARKALERA